MLCLMPRGVLLSGRRPNRLRSVAHRLLQPFQLFRSATAQAVSIRGASFSELDRGRGSTLRTRSTFAGRIRLTTPGETFPSAPARKWLRLASAIPRFKPISSLRPAWPAGSSGRAVRAPSSSQRVWTFNGRFAWRYRNTRRLRARVGAQGRMRLGTLP